MSMKENVTNIISVKKVRRSQSSNKFTASKICNITIKTWSTNAHTHNQKLFVSRHKFSSLTVLCIIIMKAFIYIEYFGHSKDLLWLFSFTDYHMKLIKW